MAIAITPNPAMKRIVDALGLGKCVSLSLSAQVGSVVTVTAEQYVTESQLDALATAVEMRDYVLVPKSEYEALRSHRCLWGNDPSGPHYTDEYLASLPEPPEVTP